MSLASISSPWYGKCHAHFIIQSIFIILTHFNLKYHSVQSLDHWSKWKDSWKRDLPLSLLLGHQPRTSLKLNTDYCLCEAKNTEPWHYLNVYLGQICSSSGLQGQLCQFVQFLAGGDPSSLSVLQEHLSRIWAANISVVFPTAWRSFCNPGHWIALSVFHTLPQICLYTSIKKSMLIPCCFFITCVHPTLWARPWEMNPAVDSTSDFFNEFSLGLCFLAGWPPFLTGLNKGPKMHWEPM